MEEIFSYFLNEGFCLHFHFALGPADYNHPWSPEPVVGSTWASLGKTLGSL